MRDREYLIAIFARGGILCAETLRFHDEIRDPASIGLPAPSRARAELVAAFKRSIASLSAKSLSRSDLADDTSEALRALIDKKRKAGRDVIHTGQHVSKTASDGDDQVDLLETIRRSLRQSRGKTLKQYRTLPSHNGPRRKSAANRH
jgi:DNA end-binding protein Ku